MRTDFDTLRTLAAYTINLLAESKMIEFEIDKREGSHLSFEFMKGKIVKEAFQLWRHSNNGGSSNGESILEFLDAKENKGIKRISHHGRRVTLVH